MSLLDMEAWVGAVGWVVSCGYVSLDSGEEAWLWLCDGNFCANLALQENTLASGLTASFFEMKRLHLIQ